MSKSTDAQEEAARNCACTPTRRDSNCDARNAEPDDSDPMWHPKPCTGCVGLKPHAICVQCGLRKLAPPVGTDDIPF